MSKINSITLSNFKFFGKEETIELGGKHLLLYGENGSGKSSIYWALYTLLEASHKAKHETDKYFLPITKSEESLVNVYAEEIPATDTTMAHCNSYIRVEDDNKHLYSLSLQDSSVSGDSEAIESSKKSDFLNYQSLFKFQDFRNSQNPDLYEIFENAVLPYLTFGSFVLKGKTIANAGEMWAEYQKGPGTTYNYKGDKIQVYKNSEEYQRFVRFERHFNVEFNRIIDYINSNAQSLIKEFGYDIDFHLDYIPPTHQKRDKVYKCEKFKVELIITKYNGKDINIRRPQTFLNEAKMSALATAIRLAILDSRISSEASDAMKILVLDDLMISLDFGNRNSLLNVLLKKYYSQYQLLIMTHDRSFFDCVLNHIQDDTHLKNWMILELYEGFDGDKSIPVLQQYDAPLSKAYAYYKGDNRPIDYNACGNNQRQALEEIFKKQFVSYGAKDKNGELIKVDKLMIDGCISLAREIYPIIGFETDLLDELDIYRKQSLNPTSHHNPKTNYYKAEIDRTFQIINLLGNYQIRPLISHDEIINLTIACEDGSVEKYRIQLLNDILMYKKPDGIFYIMYEDKRPYCIVGINGKDSNIKTGPQTLKELYEDTINGLEIKLHKKAVVCENILSVYQFNDKTLEELLNKANA